MGKCNYCGQSAGMFKDFHPECKQLNADGWAKMIALSAEAVETGENIDSLPVTLSEISKSSYIPEHHCLRAIVLGWGHVLDKFLDDSILTEEEQAKLLGFADRLELTPEDLNVEGAFDRVIRANTLSEIFQGRIPKADVRFQLPFNLKKSETVVYIFPSVGYMEERTHRSYVGGSHGVSIRVMKGVYYRVGAFKGKPVSTSQIEHVDSGMLLVTSENLYFQGNHKGFRVPYSKIISFYHYSDGIGIQREAASAKPQIFVTGDGWFTCNLIESLARMAQE